MKNHRTVESRESKVESKQNIAPLFFHPRPSTLGPRRAFTLIELLVVISIIATLAAFTVPVLQSVKRTEYIKKTQAELAQLETAIESYKAAYGFYPPSNPNYATFPNDAMFNPLYFELLGTTNNNPANPLAGTYYTLDGSASIQASDVPAAFGIGGFINCTKPGAGEDAPAAKNFIRDLKPNQIGAPITNNAAPGVPLTLLLGSAGGPDPSYQPLNAANVNPWRYNSSNPTNNPNGYDLWIQLKISGKTNLICNWSKQVQFNSPLP